MGISISLIYSRNGLSTHDFAQGSQVRPGVRFPYQGLSLDLLDKEEWPVLQQ